jgi:hypothetical protein
MSKLLRDICTSERYGVLVELASDIERAGVPEGKIVTLYTGLGEWQYHTHRPNSLVFCQECQVPVKQGEYVAHLHDHAVLKETP